jgi:hypothetical protein
MKLISRVKPRFQLSSVRSVGQPMFFGRKVCRNSGRCGSVEIAAIEERSYWKMATLRLSFKKNGKSGVRAECVLRVVCGSYWVFARYLRWNGLITSPGLRSAWKVWFSIMKSASSESCALMNSV